MTTLVEKAIDAHIDVAKSVRLIDSAIETLGRTLCQSIQEGNKVLFAGNGGSAADAQHLAAEIVGRFEKERSSLAAIALTTDSSTLTSIANDYGFESIFSRQVEALGQEGDVLVAISTSGNSPNILKAVEAAKANGLITIGLLGKNGGKLKDLVDHALLFPRITPHAFKKPISSLGISSANSSKNHSSHRRHPCHSLKPRLSFKAVMPLLVSLGWAMLAFRSPFLTRQKRSRVVGFDVSPERVANLQNGQSPLKHIPAEAIKDAREKSLLA